jgi:hypothetical protein
LITPVKKITNVALVIADPFYKKIWAGVPSLMQVIKCSESSFNYECLLILLLFLESMWSFLAKANIYGFFCVLQSNPEYEEYKLTRGSQEPV